MARRRRVSPEQIAAIIIAKLQARIRVLTEALEEVRKWIDHDPHHISELRAFIDGVLDRRA